MLYGLKELAEYEGFDDEMEFLEEYIYDSVVPGICTICGYTIGVKPDQDAGWCEICGKQTVKSALILAGVI